MTKARSHPGTGGCMADSALIQMQLKLGATPPDVAIRNIPATKTFVNDKLPAT